MKDGVMEDGELGVGTSTSIANELVSILGSCARDLITVTELIETATLVQECNHAFYFSGITFSFKS